MATPRGYARQPTHRNLVKLGAAAWRTYVRLGGRASVPTQPADPRISPWRERIERCSGPWSAEAGGAAFTFADWPKPLPKTPSDKNRSCPTLLAPGKTPGT